MTEEQEKTASNNTISVADAGPCRKKVSIEIPEETIKKATDEQYQTLQKDALVPGFRKGRAPRKLLEKRFGKDTTEQIKLKLLANASETAIKDQKIDYLREPEIDYKKVELPADLPPLEGIELTKTKARVSESDVDKEIEQIQKWAGLWTPKDGKIENGDQLVADVIIKTEDDQQEEKIENTQVFVRENGFAGPVLVKDLDKLLIGSKTGDTKETTVDIPKTYYVEKYRGKNVQVKITIKDVKWLKPAELGPELFKRFEASNVSELRQRVQESLTGKLEQQARQEMNTQLYKYLLEKTNFDLPLDIVAEQANAVLQRQYLNLLRMGLAKEQIIEKLEDLKAASDQQAKEELKIFFVINKISEKFAIETSEEEINGYIAQMALSQNQRPEHLRQTMERSGQLSQLSLQIREDKCLAKLLETAKITEVEQKPAAEKKPAKETKKVETKPPKKEVKETKEAAPKKPAGKTAAQKSDKDKKETKPKTAAKKKAGK
jgi:trigger factor